jgi:hypothetical protein
MIDCRCSQFVTSRRMGEDGRLTRSCELRELNFAFSRQALGTPNYPTPAPDVPRQLRITEPPSRETYVPSIMLGLRQSPCLFTCADCNCTNQVVITLNHEGLLVYAVYSQSFLPKRPPDILNLLSLAQFPLQSPVTRTLSVSST